MSDKIEQAQEILSALKFPENQQNRIVSLTFIALCGILPDDDWQKATKQSKTLTKDILQFVNHFYGTNYKANTRESFRKQALIPFLRYNIILLNPDDNNLKPSSSKTHYALTDQVLNVVKSYKTSDWDNAVKNFENSSLKSTGKENVYLKSIKIDNYKSVIEDTIDLGKFNVLIGNNGCGKTNILEAIAMAGASTINDANFEGLSSRGVRIARHDLTLSSFLATPQKKSIDLELTFQNNEDNNHIIISLYPENENDIYTKWTDLKQNFNFELLDVSEISTLIKEIRELDEKMLFELIKEGLKLKKSDREKYKGYLSDFSIFDINTRSLRGVVPTDSRKTPLGINGEGLDLLLSNFSETENHALKTNSSFFDWLDSFYTDKGDNNKRKGLKAGRSNSILYFVDKYMQKSNNTFSAENSNEGILHVLFYLALFISSKTPRFFAIDNIETALNPRLCQKLISVLVKLSKQFSKQVIITTHNPAILDGLNLLDDEQRLFEVYRNIEGKTKTRRIKFKTDLSDKSHKLSEMWMNGLLGAIPKNF